MAKLGLLPEIPPQSTHVLPKCDSCILGQQTETPVPKVHQEGEGHRAMQRLEKIWVDLTGTHAVPSRTGNLYIMNIVDDFTSFPWSIPLKVKSDVFPQLQVWERARENETGLRVGMYRTDHGELKSDDMASWLASRGTDHQYTAPDTSAHIGCVERMHRTLMGKARTMRLYANHP